MFKKYVDLFGLRIDNISLMRAMALARASLHLGEQRIFFTPNLEMLEGARKNEGIRETLNSASVLLPDGIGVLLASNLLQTPLKTKIAGIDFGEKLIALSEREEKSVFLLGGRDGVAKKAAKNLIKKYPNLKICGIHNGYFENEDEIVRKINNSAPDVLIVCMGFPMQESFVIKHKKDFENIKVITCLGGALDVWSGKKVRAPEFLQKVHLEWAWRTVIEPKRALRLAKSLPVLAFALGNKFQKLVSNKSIKVK